MAHCSYLSFLATVKWVLTRGIGGLYGRYLGTSLYIFLGLDKSLVIILSKKKHVTNNLILTRTTCSPVES